MGCNCVLRTIIDDTNCCTPKLFFSFKAFWKRSFNKIILTFFWKECLRHLVSRTCRTSSVACLFARYVTHCIYVRWDFIFRHFARSQNTAYIDELLSTNNMKCSSSRRHYFFSLILRHIAEIFTMCGGHTWCNSHSKITLWSTEFLLLCSSPSRI